MVTDHISAHAPQQQTLLMLGLPESLTLFLYLNTSESALTSVLIQTLHYDLLTTHICPAAAHFDDAERRHHAPHSRFDRLHHRGPDLRRSPVEQPADLPPHQRPPLPLPSDGAFQLNGCWRLTTWHRASDISPAELLICSYPIRTYKPIINVDSGVLDSKSMGV